MLKSSMHVCVHVVIKSVHTITCSVTVAVGILLSGYLIIINATTWFQNVTVYNLITQDSTEAV